MDFTGTGNTLNMIHPRTLQLIMDSLRYWIEEMHVDGFRFDLASTLGGRHLLAAVSMVTCRGFADSGGPKPRIIGSCFVLQSAPSPHTAPVHPPAEAGGCTLYASSSLEASRPADWSRVARLAQRLRRKFRTSCFCRSSSASKLWITAFASDGPN
jgi:hypothetical protein